MTYRVREIFDTIQGEGSRAGCRSVFVRFAGCNLWNGLREGREKGKGECARWCDTDFVGGEPLTAQEICDRVDALWPSEKYRIDQRWVVLTGGEPMLQVDAALISTMHGRGLCVAMETNGTLDPDGGRLLDAIDHLCVSPKLGSDLRRRRAHEIKIVVPGIAPAAPGDIIDPERVRSPGWTADKIEPLERFCETYDGVFIQPQDSTDPGQRKVNCELAIGMVMRRPRWRLSVQAHKILGLP